MLSSASVASAPHAPAPTGAPASASQSWRHQPGTRWKRHGGEPPGGGVIVSVCLPQQQFDQPEPIPVR
jgi:hypothetical protein